MSPKLGKLWPCCRTFGLFAIKSSRLGAPPNYPAIAIQRRWEGTVLLRIWIHETGRVTDVEIARTSGYPVLDGAAATAVRPWNCIPASRGGLPAATVELLPVRFKL